MAILDFASHENFSNQKKRLTAAQKSNILNNPKNIAIMEHVQNKREEAIQKKARFK